MNAIITGDEKRAAGDQKLDQLHARPDSGRIIVDQAMVGDADRKFEKPHHHQRVDGDEAANDKNYADQAATGPARLDENQT
ncbi:MAG: hypothetical protein ABI414_00090 [Devosia sp.]